MKDLENKLTHNQLMLEEVHDELNQLHSRLTDYSEEYGKSGELESLLGEFDETIGKLRKLSQ